MKTTTQHWSGPNGCADGCPACAARKTPLSEELEITLEAAVFQFDDEDGATDDGIELVREASEIVHSKEWAVYAAAPDLLASLISVRDRWENVKQGRYTARDIREELDAMNAAIAKANGGAK